MLILLNINVVVYAFLNTKSINFKSWIKDILIGYNILNQYADSSIFIKENKYYKETQNNSETLWNVVVENLTKSDLTSIQGDSSTSIIIIINFI